MFGIIGIVSGFSNCLCWVGVSFLDFCFLSRFLECDICVLAGRQFSLDLIAVGTGSSRLNFLNSVSWE